MIARPPASLTALPVWFLLSPGECVRRIWTPGTRPWAALDFRTGSPQRRFDHHDDLDPRRAILYAARTLSCCVGEVFSGFRIVERHNRAYAVLEVTREIRLIDLTNSGAQSVGTVAAIGSIADVPITQEWSRFLYSSLSAADGLVYSGAHNAEVAFAFYERAQGKLSLIRQYALDDARMDAALRDACDSNRLGLW
jgi:hypothetical protein